MQIAKKNDGLSLRNILVVFRKCDPTNCGSMDQETFEEALR